MPLSKKLIFVTAYYPPDFEATGRLIGELVSGLSEFGYDCSVITRRNRKRILQNNGTGVTIHEIFTPHFSKKSKILRFLEDLWFSVWSLPNLFRVSKNATVIFTTNPNTLCLIGYYFKIASGRKYTLLVYDIYPEIASVLGIVKLDSFIYKIYLWFRNRSFWNAEQLITVSENMAETIRTRVFRGNRGNSVQVISNWAERSYELVLRSTTKKKNSSLFQIVYAGNIGYSQDFDSIISLAKAGEGRWNIYMIGTGVQQKSVEAAAAANKLSNVIFSPFLTENSMIDFLLRSDLGLIPLKPNILLYSMPSKLYTYLAAGLPVAAMAEQKSDLSRILKVNQCGFSVDPGDSNQFIDRVEYFYQKREELVEMSHRARLYYEQSGKFIHRAQHFLTLFK
jgi:glycosyltransferase involved in cell wall biosynthesis